eukprot:s2253_g9.t1
MLPLVGAGAVAAGVAQRASRVGRRAEKTFAGGIVGSKLHGWGEYQFDPLGLAEKFPENLAWFRESELKHGRVAMLAFVGFIVPDAIRLPIEPLTDPSLDFINAHNKLIGPGLGEGPMWWLMCVVGAIESVRFKQLGLAFENLTTENAGDLGLRGFAPSSAEGMESMKMKELKNGRLAMLAVGRRIRCEPLPIYSSVRLTGHAGRWWCPHPGRRIRCEPLPIYSSVRVSSAKCQKVQYFFKVGAASRFKVLKKSRVLLPRIALRFIEQRVNFLRQCPLILQALQQGIVNPADLAAMANYLNEKSLNGNQVVVRQGDEVQSVIFVRSGSLAMLKLVEVDGKELEAQTGPCLVDNDPPWWRRGAAKTGCDQRPRVVHAN